MKKLSSQKGYALLIVLFLIVFIITITAVFMRGSISNAYQNKTVDKNNLVVVAAEAGVDYYTWELKKVFDVKELEAEFTRLVEEAIARKEKPEDYYINVQEKIADDFKEKLEKRVEELEKGQAIDLFSKYDHSLSKTVVERTYRDEDIWLTVKGTSIGSYPKTSDMENNEQELNFDLVFVIPKVQDTGSDTDGTTSDGKNITMPTLKDPKKPSLPIDIIGISKPQKSCSPHNNRIENQDCYSSSLSGSSYSIDGSKVFIDNTLNPSESVNIENSYINIKLNLTSKNMTVSNTDLFVSSNITMNGGSTALSKVKLKAVDYQSSGGSSKFNNVQMDLTGKLSLQVADIENSTIRMNEFFIHSSNNKFNKTDLTVATKYTSGGVKFENSNIDVKGNLSTNQGLLHPDESNVKIGGNVTASNGSLIENSVIKIGGNYTNNQTPINAENSDVFVGGSVNATNGTDLKSINMVVREDYNNSQIFTLNNTNIGIGGSLKLSNGGNLENSLLIANSISSDTLLYLDGSVVYANNLKSDRMTIKDSKICARDFDVRALQMDKNSRVYYSNTFKFNQYNSNFPAENILKLPSEEFEKKCGMNDSQAGSIEWLTPFLEKVKY